LGPNAIRTGDSNVTSRAWPSCLCGVHSMMRIAYVPRPPLVVSLLMERSVISGMSASANG
jgi:hypothetical protein